MRPPAPPRSWKPPGCRLRGGCRHQCRFRRPAHRDGAVRAPVMTRPLPRPNAMTAPFWDAALRGELLVAECASCGRRYAPPEARCPYCREDWRWVRSPGTGSVYTYSVVYRAPSPEFAAPYVLAVVELDDGWMMTTNIVDCDPDAV